MGKFSPDLLIYVLIIGGILYFNYLAQRAARRQREEAAAEPPAQEEPLEEIFGRVPSARAAGSVLPSAPARTGEPRPVAAAVWRRRSAARALVQGPGELRRAIVVMTVLGPCRALEPPGAAPGGAGASGGGRALTSAPRP